MMFLIHALCAGSVVAAAATAAAHRYADGPHGKEWRASQRAELAKLIRPPEPPAGIHPADGFLSSKAAKARVHPPALVDDHTFVRRAFLDTVGLLPSVEELRRFEVDRAADKRARLIDHVLADNQGYAEHWMSFWNDLLRNDEQTNIDGLRKPITPWLYASLHDNKPVDAIVAELLDPGPFGPDGYLNGVNWRGRVNASQLPPVQAAQNVAQVFLASSIKCASCHNSFINRWKLEQAYGLASFFAPENLEMHRCDKPTGKIVPPRFLFAGLGEVSPKADLETRHRVVARMVARPRDERFAKTVVNRLWKRLLGRGLAEPLDDFDSRPPRSPLLDWLAHDFMSHDYDAKHAVRVIMTSRIYQSPVAASDRENAITSPAERRLTSEQFLDAVAMVTDYWPKADVMNVSIPGLRVRAWRYRKPSALAVALGRPNREQVCTQRSEDSTVLQALELVNGSTLAERLHGGARALLASKLGSKNAGEVTEELYLRALGRAPNAAEIELARPLLGTPSQSLCQRQEGWEDFLWELFMSPEFQFVR